ncbi:MAG TPA: ATP-binding protein [Candidatus Polarisedimenticolia bacterium]|nr:ATP-binding protein [Candidatus Polarisedimenticolia bacterium]
MTDGHLVQYYEKEGFLFDRVTDFMSDGLRGNDAAILIATRAHRDGVESRLRRKGVDLNELKSGGRYHPLDAQQTLSLFMVDGTPDPQRFVSTIGPVIQTARGGDRRVLAFGEMVALLWAEGNRDAAVRLEELWNDLAQHETFALLCAYPISHFNDAGYAKQFADINAAHTWITPAESYSIVDGDERNRVISALQQKAAALEAESKQRAVLESALRSKIDELAEIDRRKDEFLAMLGHELRNPLAPVTTALQIMRIHENEPSRVARSREIVERQIEHMSRLIDDLLDVSRITRGKIELREQPLLLSSVIERAIESARPLIDERGHRVVLDLPTEPVTFLADPARLAQVFANLLNNAAKYTDVGGRIWLRARVEGDQIVVGVKDDGPGLTKELRKHAFDLFMQGPQTRARARGGLGIGLTLVRRLVELHGGTVEALSEGPGKGTEFVVRLPVRLPVVADGAQPTAAIAALGPRRRILVVDDNVDAAEALGELLRDYGHEVVTAHDGAQALDSARLHRPEIILLDISMPEMDGYEVAKRIRGELSLGDALLIALTGYGEDRHRRLAREAGFDQHVTKPVDALKLEELLKVQL